MISGKCEVFSEQLDASVDSLLLLRQGDRLRAIGLIAQLASELRLSPIGPVALVKFPGS